MRQTFMPVAVAVLAALSGSFVYAQEETSRYRTAVSAVGGLSVGSSRSLGRGGFGGGSVSAFAAGGSLAHDFSPRLTLEATGLYLDRSAGAWSADAGLRVNLAASGKSLVPYFAVSGGVYGERGDGNTPRGRPSDQHGRPRLITTETSRRTDGLTTLGGGVTFAAGPHVFVRPDARAQVVFSGDTRVLGLFTLSFGYRL
jgi:hypothetical protein